MKPSAMTLGRRARRCRISTALLFGAALVVLTLSSAGAQDVDPYLQPDESFVTLSGKVESVRRDNFTLDYGDGLIVVEMDDGDRDADAYVLSPGDEVAVAGRIDDDFFDSTSIEAASVYVENTGTTFFAVAEDTEGLESVAMTVTAEPIGETDAVRGRVTSVSENSFTLDTGPRELRVDVSALDDNPLDGIGYLQIEIGDKVEVRGDFDRSVFAGRTLVADSVIELYGYPEPGRVD